MWPTMETLPAHSAHPKQRFGFTAFKPKPCGFQYNGLKWIVRPSPCDLRKEDVLDSLMKRRAKLPSPQQLSRRSLPRATVFNVTQFSSMVDARFGPPGG